MEEVKIISTIERQQVYLSALQIIIGVQFWIPEECIQSQSIFHMEEGGYMYVYNTSVMNKPNFVQKAEVHENKDGRLLVQLVNNNLEERVLWFNYFNDINDLIKNVSVIKEFIDSKRMP